MIPFWMLFLECWLWSLDHFLQPSLNFFLFLIRHGCQLSIGYWYCSCIMGIIFCLNRKEIYKRMIPILASSTQANLLIYISGGSFVLLGSCFFGRLLTFFFPKNPLIRNGNKDKYGWESISKSENRRYCSFWRRWACESAFICWRRMISRCPHTFSSFKLRFRRN